MNDIKRFMDDKGRVKIWPAKREMKYEILEYVSTKFECGKSYSEKEVNKIIEEWHTFSDYFMIRRGLIDCGLLSRTRSGSSYWKEERDTKPEIV